MNGWSGKLVTTVAAVLTIALCTIDRPTSAHGVWALWVEAPLLLVTIIGGGMAPESLKDPILVSGFILIPLGWVVIGASLLRTKTLETART